MKKDICGTADRFRLFVRNWDRKVRVEPARPDSTARDRSAGTRSPGSYRATGAGPLRHRRQQTGETDQWPRSRIGRVGKPRDFIEQPVDGPEALPRRLEEETEGPVIAAGPIDRPVRRCKAECIVLGRSRRHCLRCTNHRRTVPGQSWRTGPANERGDHPVLNGRATAAAAFLEGLNETNTAQRSKVPVQGGRAIAERRRQRRHRAGADRAQAVGNVLAYRTSDRLELIATLDPVDLHGLCLLLTNRGRPGPHTYI